MPDTDRQDNLPEMPQDGQPELSDGQVAVRELYEWMGSLVFALVTVIVLLTFVFKLVGVEGSSMVPTLADGDKVLISGLFYAPKGGDIVVITQPNFSHKPLIKRIIATAGQVIDINYATGQVFVDGKEMEEPYISEPTHNQGDIPLPLTVPEGKVFVMGDNRNASTDSRDSLVGLIDTRYILGRTFLRVYPFGKLGGVNGG